jgi:hypothetical protein
MGTQEECRTPVAYGVTARIGRRPIVAAVFATIAGILPFGKSFPVAGAVRTSSLPCRDPGERCHPRRGCCDGSVCVDGICREGVSCGTGFCTGGQVCCNDSCGICAFPGDTCPQEIC